MRSQSDPEMFFCRTEGVAATLFHALAAYNANRERLQ